MARTTTALVGGLLVAGCGGGGHGPAADATALHVPDAR